MSHSTATICLIEDDEVMGGSIVQRLEIEGRTVGWSHTGGDGIAFLNDANNGIEIVICDIRLPDISGEEVFERLSRIPNCPPFLFITGHGDIEQAVRLMRAGAADFMTKPFAMEEFLRRVRHIARGRSSDPASVEGRLGTSSAMREIERTLQRYADHTLPVLITGETGTGKEVAARYLHEISSRADKPFVAVNCAAIPADLLESELFGHERGAFTGANSRHVGYAERAGEGTLFLDEVADMPQALQAKLLRLLESGGFNRLGGEREVELKARVVAATHQDLTPGAEEGFRQDLYYRLAVLPVELPPLRDRGEDIAWLMDTLLATAVARRESRTRGFTAAAVEAATSYSWPGNIRELRNRVERAVAVANGEWILPGDLFPDAWASGVASALSSLSDVRDAAERQQIERALSQTDGRLAKAAQILEISRTTLWKKMTRHGLSGNYRFES